MISMNEYKDRFFWVLNQAENREYWLHYINCDNEDTNTGWHIIYRKKRWDIYSTLAPIYLGITGVDNAKHLALLTFELKELEHRLKHDKQFILFPKDSKGLDFRIYDLYYEIKHIVDQNERLI